jgi:hypothetical protein
VFSLKRSLVALVIFGVTFGYVEAAVVVYLRAFYEPIHTELYPDRQPGDLFPLIRLEDYQARDPGGLVRLRVELGRELATILMLAAIGLAVGGNLARFLSAFLVAFGIWDLAFYASLKVLLDWPASLFTWDLLFLLPVPWTGPVIAPVLVAISMVLTGVAALAREARGIKFRPNHAQWAAIIAGGLIVVVAFCWDFRNILAGGRPNPFEWRIFALGESLGLIGFALAYLNGLTIALRTSRTGWLRSVFECRSRAAGVADDRNPRHPKRVQSEREAL